MHRSIYRLSGVFLLVVVMVCGFGRSGQAADVAFRWAILAEVGGVMQSLDFSSPPEVHSGTPMQFYLEHLENCYIYLYLHDAGDQVAALFPMAGEYYNYGFPRGQKFFPPGDRTFTFVPPGGMETFILVASAQRPFQLEKLTDELLKNPESRLQQQLLLSEIEAMIGTGKREARSKKAEDLVSVERRRRPADGSGATTSFQAVEVDIADFYGRKLLIDHR